MWAYFIAKRLIRYITGNNGRWEKAYVKISLDKDRGLEKEPWDSSSEKAKNLKLEDFGAPDEIREKVQMPRIAKNRKEAVEILKKIAKDGKLTSRSGIIASLSGKSIDEIVSGQALHQSFDNMAHWLAAANADKLFSNAIEPWKFELAPQKNNENLKNRRYLYSPMEYRGRILPVKFTVKEYKHEKLDKRLYSIEAINFDLRAKK